MHTLPANGTIAEKAFKGKIVYYNGDKNDPVDKTLLSAIQVELNSGNESDTLLIKGGQGVTGFNKTVSINGLKVSLGFGSKVLYTDFFYVVMISCLIVTRGQITHHLMKVK